MNQTLFPEGASDSAKLVYLYLKQVSNATIQELRDVLGMKLLKLYPVLERLEDSGAIEYVSNDRVKLVS